MLRRATLLSRNTRIATRSIRSPLVKRSYASDQPSTTTKESGSIGKKILYLTLLGAGSFAGATFYALHDDDFRDIYTKYVPERILIGASHISTHTGLLKESVVDWYDYLGDAFAYIKGDKEPPVTAPKQLQKRTVVESPLFDNIIHGDTVEATFDTFKSEEPLVDDLIKTTQQLMETLNQVGLAGHAKRLGELAGRGIQSIDQELKVVREGQEMALNKLKDLTQRAGTVDKEVTEHYKTMIAKVTEAQDESKRQVMNRVAQLKQQMVVESHKVQQQLAEMGQLELNNQRDQAMAQLKDDLQAQVVDLQHSFVKQVQDQVDRNGRLVGIDQVSANQTQLEQLALTNADQLDKSRQSLEFIVTIDALKRAAYAGNSQSFLQELKALRGGPVQVVVASISDSVAQHGISSFRQLVDRFEHVAAEVREASLIPEQGSSMVSHVISLVLSKLLFAKQGLVPGEDIEARLARAEYYLVRQEDLDSAARELNQLKGWPKHLAADWLDAARRHLEVKQALDVLRSQAVLNSLLLLD